MNGVILGRFMPPHSGHLYLLDFARAMVDRLYVLVCTLSSEPIPGDLRFRWMTELAPNCTVIHITEEIPEAQRGAAGATTIWADSIRRAVPEPVGRVFASEEYGWDLAHRLDAQFVPVDPGRHNIPVSATAIRERPMENWRFIPAPVRPWFVRHVVLIDQSERATELAAALDTVVAHPYREFWQLTWNRFGGRRAITPLQPPEIERGARATVDALARQANRILLHDLRRVEDLRDLTPDITPRLIIADPAHQEELARFFGSSSPLIIQPRQATPWEIAAIAES
jgi:HTH-type transcriptional regulator, transcriptional repressor of NAD biosynthesis genes